MRKVLALSAILAFVPAALADERATTKEAEMMVHHAVAFLKKEGPEKAFAAFSDPKGAFTYRDLYIFVLDTKGVMRAHGVAKEMIGKDQMRRKDPSGKFITREQLELAKSKGSGWTEYGFENPATGKMEHKVSYVELVGDFVVGCGAFVK
jgi:cytochrome c